MASASHWFVPHLLLCLLQNMTEHSLRLTPQELRCCLRLASSLFHELDQSLASNASSRAATPLTPSSATFPPCLDSVEATPTPHSGQLAPPDSPATPLPSLGSIPSDWFNKTVKQVKLEYIKFFLTFVRSRLPSAVGGVALFLPGQRSRGGVPDSPSAHQLLGETALGCFQASCQLMLLVSQLPPAPSEKEEEEEEEEEEKKKEEGEWMIK